MSKVVSLSDKVITQLDWLKQSGNSYSDVILNHLPQENDICSLITDGFRKLQSRLKAISVPTDILDGYHEGIETLRCHLIQDTKKRLGIKSPWEEED